MELYLIKDKKYGIYYTKESKPFFYAFSDAALAERFVNENPDSEIDIIDLEEDGDDEYLTEILYNKGYKGGYLNGNFKTMQETSPELVRKEPMDSATLALKLFSENKKTSEIKNQKFYFFATITEDGYLAFANTDGFIFAFSSSDMIDALLAKKLFSEGYDVIKYVLDDKHKYFFNYGKPLEIKVKEGLSLL